MNHEEKLQLLWATSFVVSGIIFAFAIYMTPMVGLFALGYIILYVGLSIAFMIVYKSLNTVNESTLDNLKMKKREIEQIKREIEKKFFKKKIDRETYDRMIQEYEKQLTEIEVKIKNLERMRG